MTRRALRLFVLAALLLLAPATGLGQDIAGIKTIEVAKLYYEEIAATPPSRPGEKQFLDIIADRIRCYNDAKTPLERLKLCNITYLDRVVATSRQYIKSSPQLGQFLRMAQYCPIIYGMCKGNRRPPADCRGMEHQCIDFSLDRYWRGLHFSTVDH